MFKVILTPVKTEWVCMAQRVDPKGKKKRATMILILIWSSTARVVTDSFLVTVMPGEQSSNYAT